MEKIKNIPKEVLKVLNHIKEQTQSILYNSANVSLEEMKRINLLFMEVEKCLKIRTLY